MTVSDKTTSEKLLPWIVWAAISPVLLYALIDSPFGLLLIIVGALGGGGFLVIGLAVLVLGGGVIGLRSQGDSGFTKGIAVILIPFAELFLYYGVSKLYSDENVASTAEKKAQALLEKQAAIPINGLYTESISLRYGLYGLLVDRQISMIEGDVSGAGWLFDLTNDIMSIKSAGKKYFRLSLGPLDNPNCFSWRNESDNPVKTFPVRPRTCVIVVFDNNLLSDTKLHINAERIGKRELYLELFRIGENVPIASVPFWDKQYKDSPSHYYARYQSPDASGAFAGLIRKLTPRDISLGADKKPFILSWISRKTGPALTVSTPATTVRLASDAWGEKRASHETSWEDGYQLAQETGRPTVLKNTIVVLPKSHQIYKKHEGDTELFASACCAFTIDGHHLEYGIQIAMEHFSGEESLTIRAKPDFHPGEISGYMANPSRCRFFASGLKVTETELIAIGQYYCGSSEYFGKPVGSYYEWAVPLDQLPSWVRS